MDLNCGCPANTVTGNGAGSSLLRTPERLHEIVSAMVVAVGGAAPVSVKLRAGYEDTSLFDDNLLAVQVCMPHMHRHTHTHMHVLSLSLHVLQGVRSGPGSRAVRLGATAT